MKPILQTLIKIPSVTGDYQANHQALDYIDHFLSERGMFVKRLDFNGAESLVATTQRTKTPKVFLVAHADVVPTQANHFKLTEKDDKLFGRGTFDMKFAIAAYLHLIDRLQDDLKNYDFGIMITTDEEVGGYNGVAQLVQAGYIPEACVIPDGGDNWAVETFAKGITWFDITMPGKSGHASRPWEGDNALDKLLVLLSEIKKLFPSQEPGSDIITLSQIHAGTATNQIPGSAQASIDIRYTSSEAQISYNELIQSLCKTHGATFKVPVNDPPCINDPENPYLAQFMRDIEQVIGYPSSTTVSFATSDGRFFSAAGVVCAIVRPPGGGHHGAGEWISKEGFYQFYEVLRRYVTNVARAKTVVVGSAR